MPLAARRRIRNSRGRVCVPEYGNRVLRELGRSLNEHETMGFRESGNLRFSQRGSRFALLAAFLLPFFHRLFLPSCLRLRTFGYLYIIYFIELYFRGGVLPLGRVGTACQPILCREAHSRRIPFVHSRAIPADAEKPSDPRIKNTKGGGGHDLR